VSENVLEPGPISGGRTAAKSPVIILILFLTIPAPEALPGC
jgi:hypothetical protein